jgi:hypothetical protein
MKTKGIRDIRLLEEESKGAVIVKNADGRSAKVYRHIGKWCSAVTSFCPSAFPDFIQAMENGSRVYTIQTGCLLRISNYPEADMGLIEFESITPYEDIASALRAIMGQQPRNLTNIGTNSTCQITGVGQQSR